MGDRVSELGIVLSGSVFVENTDLWGNRSILSKITPGQVFAETYAFCREPMMVNVTAAEASTISTICRSSTIFPGTSRKL
jgi:CRP/FNR family transcriptional regulator, dissimilatory nitrate respiration regulator